MEEIEVKFLDVNVEEFKKILEKEGATFIDSFEYKRKVYHNSSFDTLKKYAWVRIRDEGDRVMLAYKERFNIDSKEERTDEIEIEVSDFNLMDQFLLATGFIEKFYEENKRERYVLDSVEIDIDTWPMIPSYVELEGSSWDSVEKVAKKLGFDWGNHLRYSTMQIYEKYGINENDYSVITFEEQIKK